MGRALEFMAQHLMSHETAEVGEIALGGRIGCNDVQHFAGAHFAHAIAHQHQRLRTDQSGRVEAMIDLLHVSV